MCPTAVQPLVEGAAWGDPSGAELGTLSRASTPAPRDPQLCSPGSLFQGPERPREGLEGPAGDHSPTLWGLKLPPHM